MGLSSKKIKIGLKTALFLHFVPEYSGDLLINGVTDINVQASWHDRKVVLIVDDQIYSAVFILHHASSTIVERWILNIGGSSFSNTLIKDLVFDVICFFVCM